MKEIAPLICPSCNAPFKKNAELPTELSCTYCGTEVRLNGNENPPSKQSTKEENTETRLLIPTPEEFHVREIPGEKLIIAWEQVIRKPISTSALQAIFGVIGMLIVGSLINTSQPFLYVLMACAFFTCLVLAPRWAEKNKHQAQNGRRSIQIENGLLNYSSAISQTSIKNISVDQIRQLYCTKHTDGYFELRLLMKNNQPRLLVSNIPILRLATFLEYKIEEFLGIPVESVQGEVDRNSSTKDNQLNSIAHSLLRDLE